MTKLWFDDIRPAPEGWQWARTVEQAILILRANNVTAISLDHDLGLHHYTEAQIEADEELIFGRGQAEETGLDLVHWMIANNKVPEKIAVHSWNPDGARRMIATLNDAGHYVARIPYAVPKKGEA